MNNYSEFLEYMETIKEDAITKSRLEHMILNNGECKAEGMDDCELCCFSLVCSAVFGAYSVMLIRNATKRFERQKLAAIKVYLEWYGEDGLMELLL